MVARGLSGPSRGRAAMAVQPDRAIHALSADDLAFRLSACDLQALRILRVLGKR